MRKKVLLFAIYSIFIITISYGIKPERKYTNYPIDYGFSYENKYLSTMDSSQMMVWHIPPTVQEKKVSIIISSGDAGNMTNWLVIACNLAQIGFDIWLYDYRGFGESSAFQMESNMLYYNEFAEDLAVVVGDVKRSKPDNKICLLGFSMGSIISMLYLDKHQEDISYYIGEGHVYSPEKVVNRLNGNSSKLFTIPNVVLVNKSWDKLYRNIKIPFLLFCASDDAVCTSDDVEDLKTKVTNIEIINYQGYHLQGFSVLQYDYFQKIDAFLSENF